MKLKKETKSEINIRRLLACCQSMVSEAQHQNTKVGWRLPKYLKHLDGELEAIKKDASCCSMSTEAICELERKVRFLKDIVEADQIDNPLDKTVLCQHLLPSSIINTDREEQNTIHLQMKGKHQKDLRKELFGNDDSVRRRVGGSDHVTKDNIDDIMKRHHDMQEKVAHEMIKMAQSMKQNSLVASDMIKRDTQELESSSNLVDSNSKKLKVESDRLEEINQKTCSWTIWIMLAVVCVVFINMIIFIKFFPKKPP